MANQEQTFAKQLEAAQATVEQNRLASALSGQPEVVEEIVGKMDLAPLSLQSSQEPSIEFPIVNDEEDLNDQSHDDGDDDDDVQDGEFVFFGEVIPGSDDEDDWSDYSDEDDYYSSDDKEPNPWFVKLCGTYGGYYTDRFTGKIKTFYRFTKPDPRTSCNAAAAALKEPVSLLTKYRSQRWGGRSNYFRAVFPGPPKTLRQGSPLKTVQTVDSNALHRS